MTRRPLWALVACLTAAGCDFTGAPCQTSANCPDKQVCLNGLCGYAPAGAGGGAAAGGGSATGGGATGGSGGGARGGGAGGGSGLAECATCSGPGQCGGSLTCSTRYCDNRAACYASGGACSTIGGIACPQVMNFRPCTNSTQCEADATCQYGRCVQSCTGSSTSGCYVPAAVPTDPPLATTCVSIAGAGECLPACTGATDPRCGPLGAFCGKFTSGTYGYCELGCGTCRGPSDCPTGSTCSVRTCDGVPACYPSDGGVCSSVGVGRSTCPAVSNFGACTSSTQCGELSQCVGLRDAGTAVEKRCVETCSPTGIPCSAPSTTFNGLPALCSTRFTFADGGNACLPQCTGPTDLRCPTGTTCRNGGNGTFVCF